MSNTIDDSLWLQNRPPQMQPGNSLGKDAFMKILIAQLENQDPLNPMEDREFISQMANFSSLEQMMNMTSMFEKFIASQNDSMILEHSQMIGKQVKYMVYTENESGDVKQETRSGVVKAVSFKGGDIMFELDNEEIVRPEYIFEIREQEDGKA